MAEPRPFPPSPRRLALARASGLTAASPLLVGAAAIVAAIAVVAGLARAAAAQLGGWIAGAASAADGAAVSALSFGAPSQSSANAAGAASAARSIADAAVASPNAASLLPPSALPGAILSLTLPLVGAAAVAALLVHLAQTRALWLPRRRSLPGAPALPRDAAARSSLDLAGGVALGAVCVGWLWLTAPQLAALGQSPLAAGAAMLSLVVALAIAWVALGVIDALVRRAQLARALAMTRDDKREDDRLAAADPRWRAQRLSVLRGGGLSDAVARSVVLVLGDDTAVAIAWDPLRQPTPLRTATGRRARSTQLLALARRHRIAVHRDVALAARLVDHEGPVPEAEWGALAELVAAVRR